MLSVHHLTWQPDLTSKAQMGENNFYFSFELGSSGDIHIFPDSFLFPLNLLIKKSTKQTNQLEKMPLTGFFNFNCLLAKYLMNYWTY